MHKKQGLLNLIVLCLYQMSERAAITVAVAVTDQSAGSAVRGVSARSEMAGLNVSAGGVNEMNPLHHSIAPEVILCYDFLYSYV